MTALRPGAITRIKSSAPLENVTRFLEAAQHAGVKDSDLFAPSDLLQKVNKLKVVQSFDALRQLAPDSQPAGESPHTVAGKRGMKNRRRSMDLLLSDSSTDSLRSAKGGLSLSMSSLPTEDADLEIFDTPVMGSQEFARRFEEHSSSPSSPSTTRGGMRSRGSVLSLFSAPSEPDLTSVGESSSSKAANEIPSINIVLEPELGASDEHPVTAVVEEKPADVDAPKEPSAEPDVKRQETTEPAPREAQPVAAPVAAESATPESTADEHPAPLATSVPAIDIKRVPLPAPLPIAANVPPPLPIATVPPPIASISGTGVAPRRGSAVVLQQKSVYLSPLLTTTDEKQEDAQTELDLRTPLSAHVHAALDMIPESLGGRAGRTDLSSYFVEFGSTTAEEKPSLDSEADALQVPTHAREPSTASNASSSDGSDSDDSEAEAYNARVLARSKINVSETSISSKSRAAAVAASLAPVEIPAPSPDLSIQSNQSPPGKSDPGWLSDPSSANMADFFSFPDLPSSSVASGGTPNSSLNIIREDSVSSFPAADEDEASLLENEPEDTMLESTRKLNELRLNENLTLDEMIEYEKLLAQRVRNVHFAEQWNALLSLQTAICQGHVLPGKSAQAMGRAWGMSVPTSYAPPAITRRFSSPRRSALSSTSTPSPQGSGMNLLDLLEQQNEPEFDGTSSRGDSTPPPQVTSHEPMVGARVRAVWDFAATAPDELSLQQDDIIVVTKVESDGWMQGECNGNVGWFPSNFVERIVRPSRSNSSSVDEQMHAGSAASNRARMLISSSSGSMVQLATETRSWYQKYKEEEHKIREVAEMRRATQLSASAGTDKPRALIWKDDVGPQVAGSLSERDVRRQEVIYELIMTERDYVKDLDTLLEVYYRPLQARRIISSKDIAVLFSNVDQLLTINQELLRLMEERRARGPIIEQVGDIIKRLVRSFCGLADFLLLICAR